MKLILNKENINLEDINFITKTNYIKLVYDLNNVLMNGLHIRIYNFKIYKNDLFIYVVLLDKNDISLINNIIKYINRKINVNISLKDNIIRMKNNFNFNNDYIDININNIKRFNNKYILYVYN
jgi:hypothetical protein